MVADGGSGRLEGIAGRYLPAGPYVIGDVMGERAVVEEGTRTEPEPGSMAELYARYVPGGIRLAFLLTGDRNRADDLAHEAFVRCVGRFAHLRAHRAFEAYLRRAIVNLHTSGTVTGTRNGTGSGAKVRDWPAQPPPSPTSRVERISGGRWGRFRLDSARRSSSATTKTYPRTTRPGCSDAASPRSSHSSLAAPKRCARRSPREKTDERP